MAEPFFTSRAERKLPPANPKKWIFAGVAIGLVATIFSSPSGMFLFDRTIDIGTSHDLDYRWVLSIAVLMIVYGVWRTLAKPSATDKPE